MKTPSPEPLMLLLGGMLLSGCFSPPMYKDESAMDRIAFKATRDGVVIENAPGQPSLIKTVPFSYKFWEPVTLIAFDCVNGQHMKWLGYHQTLQVSPGHNRINFMVMYKQTSKFFYMEVLIEPARTYAFIKQKTESGDGVDIRLYDETTGKAVKRETLHESHRGYSCHDS
jgi:hypothetical protein